MPYLKVCFWKQTKLIANNLSFIQHQVVIKTLPQDFSDILNNCLKKLEKIYLVDIGVGKG